MMRGTRAAGVVAALTLALLAGGVADAAAQGGTLEVTVTYTGAGEVDLEHGIYIGVYTAIEMQPDSLIGGTAVTSNGATVTFPNLAAETVYVSAFYDEPGGWDGQSVPSGSPAGAYAEPGAFGVSPITVAADETVAVEFFITDAFRIP